MQSKKTKINPYNVVPLISATRSFTEAYTALKLLHETQTEAIKLGLQRTDLKVDPQKIKQKISEQMTEELVGKISYKIFLVTEPSAISCFFNFR